MNLNLTYREQVLLRKAVVREWLHQVSSTKVTEHNLQQEEYKKLKDKLKLT